MLAKLKEKLIKSKQVLEDTLDENFKADPVVRENRLSLCMSCEHLFKPTDSCKKCGCFVKAKTWIKDSKCPLNKW